MALGAWRLTHLIVDDDFPPIRWGRRLVVDHAPEWVGDLVSCTWCTSVWVAAGVTAGTDVVVRVRWPFLTFGAVAAVVPLLQAIVDRLERQAAAPAPVPPVAPTTYQPSRRGDR